MEERNVEKKEGVLSLELPTRLVGPLAPEELVSRYWHNDGRDAGSQASGSRAGITA